MRRRDLELVREILECLEVIDPAEAAEARHRDDGEVVLVTLDALQHSVLTIGGAVRALSPDLRDDHPAVPWAEMERLGDLAGHPPDRLEPQVFRAEVGERVRALRAGCRAILAESVRVGEDEP